MQSGHPSEVPAREEHRAPRFRSREGGDLIGRRGP